MLDALVREFPEEAYEPSFVGKMAEQNVMEGLVNRQRGNPSFSDDPAGGATDG